MPLIENRNLVYTDIDLSFTTNPFTKDIATLLNDSAVKRSIRHAIFFNKYDIPFNNTYYSTIKRILFEPLSNVSSSILANAIKSVIEKLDKRVQIKSVDVKINSQEDGYDVTITFSIIYLKDDNVMKLYLQRIR